MRYKGMRQHTLTGIMIATVVSLVPMSSAKAQPDPGREPQAMNFDLWCQEEAALPAERCDKRLPEDENAFEARRSSIEQYEVPYRSAQYDQARINSDIMNDDPIDNPHKSELGAQGQYPDTQVASAQPKSIPAP